MPLVFHLSGQLVSPSKSFVRFSHVPEELPLLELDFNGSLAKQPSSHTHSAEVVEPCSSVVESPPQELYLLAFEYLPGPQIVHTFILEVGA